MYRLGWRHIFTHNVLAVAMSTNKRIAKDTVGSAAKKLCLRNASQHIKVPTEGKTEISSAMSDVEVIQPPVKSESDKKSYRIIRLSNGLKALLISDPSASKDDLSDNEAVSQSSDDDDDDGSDGSSDSDDEDDDDIEPRSSRKRLAACSLCVDVGSFSDPRDVQGLSHFLEHMIFMGSEKFSNENEFDQFISRSGGDDNADTDYEETSFYFSVHESYLDGALDRFSQFFKGPLMLKEAMTREREAVESEFVSKMNDESIRREQILISLANTAHPISIFSWGNLITLRDGIDDDSLHKRVHEFWKRHYSAHRMYLCLQANLPLDNLQDLVVKHFKAVLNNGMTGENFTAYTHHNAFTDRFHQKIFLIKPITNVCKVDITWCMEPVHQKFKTKPDDYLGFLIGHEGKGSILSYLRRKLWSIGLCAGIDESSLASNSILSLFSITVYLTDEGFSHLKEVLAVIFSYIRYLQVVGPSERIFNELRDVENNGFRFSEESDPYENVEELVLNLKYYPPEHILNGDTLYFEYDPQGIRYMIDELNKPKFNIMITSTHLFEKNMKYDSKEEWIGTEYCERDFSTEWMELWNNVKPYPELHLPEANPFIADDFTISYKLGDVVPKIPVQLINTDCCELWHRQDDKFLLPIAHYYFYFMTPSVMWSAKNHVLQVLHSTILKHQLAEDLYAATMAGLSYTCYSSEKGLVLKVEGYNQKLHIIVNAFVTSLKNLTNEITQELFDTFVQQQFKNYENVFLKPKSINRDLRLSVIDAGHIPLGDKNHILKEITLEDLKSFSVRFCEEMKVKAIMQGNLDANKAKQIMNDAMELLNCNKIKNLNDIEVGAIQLPIGNTYLRCKGYSNDDVNTLITNYYQFGPISIRISALLDLLYTIAEEPLFDVLRSKEQLGYDVSCSIRDNHGVLGFSISINSQENKFSVDYIDERIENFRKELLQIIKNLTNDDFNRYKDSLIKAKMVDDNDIEEEITRNWAEVTSDDYVFDRLQQEINTLRLITQNELIEFYSENYGVNERKFSTQIIGNPIGIDVDEEKAEIDKSTFDQIQIVEFCNENNATLIRDIAKFKKSQKLYPQCKTLPITISE